MNQIPDNVHRFLLTSIETVPHLELLVLLWREQRPFTTEELSRRLYLGPVATRALADDLVDAELLDRVAGDDLFQVRTEPQELRKLLQDVDMTYSRNLRQVAELIHNNTERRAHKFSRAFVWRKP
jgi:hypothetical protein